MLDISKIKKEQPKSYEKLKGFVNSLLDIFQQGVIKAAPEKEGLIIPELTDSTITNYVALAIPSQPRLLYEFFDENKIKIGIAPSLEDENLWTYWNSVEKTSKVTTNRILAEEKAFEEAFSILEKQLNG